MASTAVTVIAVLLAGVQPAQADPVYPSARQVQQARERAARAATDVTAIQQQLDASASRVMSADLAVSTAAENYDAAQVELENARRSAQAATTMAQHAGLRLRGAQRQVGQLAAQNYRTGGGLAKLDVLFSPGGADQVLERATMMQAVAAGQQRTVRRMDSARVVATTLDRQAAHAVEVRDAAAARLHDAQLAAQRKSDAARSALAEQQAVRAILLGRLAAAHRTTIAIEEARQQGLAAAAERKREAAALAKQLKRDRQAAERAERERLRSRGSDADVPGDSGSGGSGSGGSGPGRLGGSGGAGSGSGDSPPPSLDPGSSSGSANAGADAVAWAKQQIGLPYEWAADGPSSYDCSGLTMRAWERSGVSLAHSSRMQYAQTSHVSYADLRKGDLIFYATDPSNPSTIHHVTIYAGAGQMVEAPYTGAFVRLVPVRRGDSMPYAGRP